MLSNDRISLFLSFILSPSLLSTTSTKVGNVKPSIYVVSVLLRNSVICIICRSLSLTIDVVETLLTCHNVIEVLKVLNTQETAVPVDVGAEREKGEGK